MSDTATVITALLQHPPIAYHRSFATIAGGVTPGLMLSQMWYWTKIQFRGNEEWFWKTQEQWNEETGLTRTEQENARKALKAKGFISEERRGNPAKLYFRLNTQCVVKALETSLESSVCMKPAIKSAGNLQTRLRETCNLYKEAETTTESTSETIKLSSSLASQDDGSKLFPDVIPPKKVLDPPKEPSPVHLIRTHIEGLFQKYNGHAAPNWSGMYGRKTKELLDANPSIPMNVWFTCINNHFRSEGRKLRDPKIWIPRLLEYKDGPLDKFGQPMEVESFVPRQKSASEQLREQGIVPGGRNGR